MANFELSTWYHWIWTGRSHPHSALMSWSEPAPVHHSLYSWNWGMLGLSTFFCPHWSLLRYSFFSLISRIEFWLHHEHYWLAFFFSLFLFFSDLMEQIKPGDSSGKSTIVFMDDSAPKLASDSFVVPAMESTIPPNNFTAAGLVFISLRELDPGNFWMSSMSHTS